MAKPLILILHPFLPDGILSGWVTEFSDCEFVGMFPSGMNGAAGEIFNRGLQMLSDVAPLSYCFFEIKHGPPFTWHGTAQGPPSEPV